jgi:hypothetical protein
MAAQAKFENYFSLQAALLEISDDKVTIICEAEKNWSILCFY